MSGRFLVIPQIIAPFIHLDWEINITKINKKQAPIKLNEATIQSFSKEIRDENKLNNQRQLKNQKEIKAKREREVEVLPYHSQVANPRCNLSLSSDPSVRTQDLEELAVNDGDWRGDRDGN